MQTFFSRNGFYSSIQHRFHQKKKERNNVEDIYDGLLYKKLSSEGILSSPDNVSFPMNTDGVPVLETCLNSIWALYLIINELPYGTRMANELGSGLGKRNQPCGLSSNLTHFPSLVLKMVLTWNRLREENFIVKEFCSPAHVIFQRAAYFAVVSNTMARMAAGNVYSLDKVCELAFAGTAGHFSTTMIIPRGRYELQKALEKMALEELHFRNRVFHGILILPTILPTSEIKRLPCSIADDLKYWKASVLH